jgi:putative FmdB family regulatory protein
MPLYEFSCSICGKTFEKNIPLDQNQSNVRCPSGHKKVHRVYSSIPIMFKGNGFYVTDHRNSSTGDGGKL